jgi:hypothetical protein
MNKPSCDPVSTVSGWTKFDKLLTLGSNEGVLKSMFSLRTTSYLLVLLILFQSFSAVANSLDYHSIDSEHLSEVHERHLGDNSASEKAQIQLKSSMQTGVDNSAIDSSHNPADCHHCGHCHGTHAQWLGHSAGIQFSSLATSHVFYYLSRVKDAPVTQLLRPPKA